MHRESGWAGFMKLLVWNCLILKAVFVISRSFAVVPGHTSHYNKFVSSWIFVMFSSVREVEGRPKWGCSSSDRWLFLNRETTRKNICSVRLGRLFDAWQQFQTPFSRTENRISPFFLSFLSTIVKTSEQVRSTSPNKHAPRGRTTSLDGDRRQADEARGSPQLAMKV